MTTPILFLSPNKKDQTGAALVVSLIVLVLLTLLGVAAMRTSVLEERMAGNMRESNIAFQSAEGALREALSTDLPSNSYDGTVPGYTKQISKFLDSGNNPVSEFSYWTKQYDWDTKSVAATKAIGVSKAPRYVVETMPAVVGVWKAGERAKRVYRVTTTSPGASDRSGAIVQGAIVRED
jgi:type IV pilus assembly protein PilX